ncbi:hypothetical protein CPB85DRAFT_1549599 [Mucidula mucida]|nr:hypothetical protein CPB85DRAFT_1549599 [Mucidula mucida]
MFKTYTENMEEPKAPSYTGRYVESPVASKKHTQEEQDAEDDEARRKAMKDLVQSWMDRLQLISVITTFFASVEAGMLQITTPSSPDESSAWQSACNACILGALVMHINASFVSFLSAFFLIRFKLSEAKQEELKAEGIEPAPSVHTKPGSVILNMAAHHITGSPKDPRPGPSRWQRIWSANPHLVQVGPFQRTPPVHLLSRMHSLCIASATVGFALMMGGIICFTWAMQPRSVSIFTSASMVGSLGSGAYALMRKGSGHSMYTD